MKLSVFCGVSVDGFLARPDDTLDFLRAGEQEPHGFTEFFASVDVVVIGRKTFEVVLKLGHLALYGKKPVVVLSSRPLDFSSVKGGSRVVKKVLAAGCVNRLVITRVPVLIGAGIPLFGPLPRDILLRHVETRSYTGGMVQSEYEIEAAEPS